MSDDPDWNSDRAYADFGYYRVINAVGRVTLPLGDNSKPTQLHQIVGNLTETRDHKQRLGEFGFSSMPLPGCKGVAVYQGGHRGFATIVATEDPRYRPSTLNPGESGVYIVDGASADGTGGTMRWVLQGLLGWVGNLLGVTINVGAHPENTTINIGNGTDTININCKDILVNGKSLLHHDHGGVEPGSGNTADWQ